MTALGPRGASALATAIRAAFEAGSRAGRDRGALDRAQEYARGMVARAMIVDAAEAAARDLAAVEAASRGGAGA